MRTYRRLPLLLLLSVVLVCSASLLVRGDGSTNAGFVYVMTNKPSGNIVIQFKRASDGALIRSSEAATHGRGGTGNGVGDLDPLGSQNSLVLSCDGSFVLAVNAGSDEISALKATENGLRLLNTILSHGNFPNSIALHGNLVYVLNGQGTPNISGYRLGFRGLAPIPDSTVDLPGGGGSAPHDIRFSPDGTRLLVSEGNTNKIDIFELDDRGRVIETKTHASAGKGPFGLKFGRNGVLFNAEATSNSLSSYILNANDTLTVLSHAVPDHQQATCWIMLTNDGLLGFVSNTGSGNFSSYRITEPGKAELLEAVQATTDGGAPIDSAFSDDDAFFYADDSKLGRILIYQVDGNQLHLIHVINGLPTTLQGIAAQ